MPRDIPVGNGRLLVCFDNAYRIRDLYFPHVGQENHVGGRMCRMGLRAGGEFAWVGEGWRRRLDYEEDTLVTRVELHREGMPVILACRDAVDFHETVYLREVEVENLTDAEVDVELFFGLDLDISGNSIGDTAAFDPKSGGVVHYKGPRYFLAGGATEQAQGFAQYAVGVKGVGGREGAWRDAEDGRLSGNPIAQGSVDSVAGLRLRLPAYAAGKAWWWIAVAESWDEARRIDGLLKHKGAPALLERTADYWRLWVHKESPELEELPASVRGQYARSLLTVATQLDDGGGILAANDSDVIAYNRDTYSYVWPRDGALVAAALDAAGYPAEARRFYAFAARAVTDGGYLLHKYNPDGTLASSWHPWLEHGAAQLPIQEDETALPLWALWQHFVLYRDVEFVKPLYRPFIKRCGDFLVAYRDAETGLPGPSWDLWEERRGILSFTVGAVFGGLTAASLFCTVFGEEERAAVYRKAASEIRDGASRHLWREDLGRFCRMVTRDGGSGPYVVDPALDASLWGLFAFGMYAPDDPRVAATMSQLREKLWVPGPTGGMARYEGDAYYRTAEGVPGNPWFIGTLWLADHMIRAAKGEEELKQAADLLEWAASHALPSGVLAEQLDPRSGQPLSVSPLTWSHATFVDVTARLLRAKGKAPHAQHAGDWIGRLYGRACDTIRGACHVA